MATKSTSSGYSNEALNAFLDKFIDWAKSHSDISAVVLVGSYARNAATEDSDIDLVILTPTFNKYLRDRSWVSAFGQVAECQEEDYGKVTSLRVFYTAGLEVEYSFATPRWAESPIDKGTLLVVKNGMKPLHDPLGLLARLQHEMELQVE